MNLAVRDIRHKLSRFLLTALGLGMLLMIVMGMAGIYQGFTEDALCFLDRAGADLWIVQRGTRGPFAEISRIPWSLEDRPYAITGVAGARAFVYQTIQREYQGQALRMNIQGLAWPQEDGRQLPLIAGRALGQAHYEMLADRSLGLHLGDRVPLAKDVYTVVGITAGMVSTAGDGSAFFTVPDAIAIQYDAPSEAIRLEHQTQQSQFGKKDLGSTQPFLQDQLPSLATILGTKYVSAIVVKVMPGVDPAEVAKAMSAWTDVTIYPDAVQRTLMLKSIERNRRQLGMFRSLLVIISAIIMALILYTLTLDKVHDIAMLKLMGARNRTIVALILQEALLLGALGYGLAYGVGLWVYPYFPRHVSITSTILVQLALVVLAISVLSSLLGIWKAMSVQPNEVLA